MKKNYAIKRAAYAPLTSSTPFRKQRFLTGFTLVEILVAIVILTVVASISIATYQKTVNTNRDTICLQNLKVLQTAIDIYTLEKDTLPTTLSQLEPRHIYLAYEKVVGKQKENSFLVFLRNRFGIKPVWAQSLAKYYANQRNVFICPNDRGRTTPGAGDCRISFPFPPGGTVVCGSYTFNFTNTETIITRSPPRPKKNSTYALVYDSPGRTNLHKKNLLGTGYALGITPGEISGKVDSGEVIVAAHIDSDRDHEIEKGDSNCSDIGACKSACGTLPDNDDKKDCKDACEEVCK